MKHLLTILSGLLVALLFARCADDDNLSGGIDGLPERGIVIRLSTGELDTRTQLTSTGDYHHVEEVWAVLYKLEGTDANDLNNYKLKGNPTKLGSMEDGQFVAWNPYKAPDAPKFNPADPDNPTDAEREKYEQELAEYNNKWGGEYGNGKVQGREFVLPESGAMTAGTYRVLCIGFDEASKTCYGLQNGSSLTLSGTLAEAYAKLSNKEFGGELFAGWQEFEFEPDNINIAEVELKRRVAGVLCYVNDIPTTITDGTETYTINTIRLCLNTKANDAIHLCRLDDRTKDFGTTKGNAFTDEDKTILAEYEIPEDIIAAHQGEVQGQGKEIFEGDLEQTFEDTNVQEGSVLLGAYLIPIEHVEGKATLSVELLEKDEDGNEKLAKTFNAVRSDDPDGELTDDATQNTTSYDILPNYIYHIGNKDDDTDEPMSLLGQKITVVPKEWTGETIPVEFPSVPIKVSMDLINEYDDVYDADRYVFDCIGIDDVEGYGNATPPTNILGNPVAEPYPLYYPNTQRLYLKVSPSVLKSHWKIKINRCDENGTIITTPDGEDGMLYILKSSGYEQDYEAKSPTEDNEGAKIPLLLTDYAVNNSNIEKRYAKITLEMFESPQASNPIDSEEMIVQQYNAIIVKYDNRVLGFSHYDWGTVRDTRTGEVETDGETAMWNYDWVILAAEIFGQTTQNTWENGAQNISWVKGRLDDKDRYEAFYDGTSKNGCAMYKAAKYRLQITDSKKETLGNPTWFLPARYEMTQFMNDKFLQRDDYHIKTNAFYWTSSTSSAGYVGSVNHYSIVLKYDVSDVKAEAKERDESYYMRQAVLISQDDN